MKTLIQSVALTVAFFIASAFFLTVLANPAINAPVRVGIIDTGLNLSDPRFSAHLCPSGHGDFSGQGIDDFDGHGTHVAGLIQQYARTSNYCLVIIKFYDKNSDDYANEQHIYNALRYAFSLHLDVLNLSLTGPDYNAKEQSLFAAHPEVWVIGAAGNESSPDVHYPCGYKLTNLLCVGAVDATNNVAPYSNYGDWVHAWERGDADSTLPHGMHGTLHGTSMATAIRSGKTIYSLDSRRR